MTTDEQCVRYDFVAPLNVNIRKLVSSNKRLKYA